MNHTDSNIQNRKYVRAKKRVKDIKAFYKHLTVYLLINFFFIFRRIFREANYANGDVYIEDLAAAFFNINNYNFFFWWGLGLILHAIGTFGIPNLFSKDWEDRKIKELMNK